MAMKKMRKAEQLVPADYLKRPYMQTLVREEDGSYRAEIAEFPGCIAVGDTAAEAIASLQDVAESWLESMLARNRPVPEPLETIDFSGKLVLRLPKSLHKKAALAAERDGVSLNQFIMNSVAEHVGMRAGQALSGVGQQQTAQIMMMTHMTTFAPTKAALAAMGQLAFVADAGIRMPVPAYG
jgi:antitoxin HicB